MSSPATARRLWALGEPFHALTYFADECRAAGEAAGLAGFWQTYFAFRAAPLGPVGPEVVTATFYNFAPAFVARAVPEVWDVAPPDKALEARLTGIDAAVRRALGDLPEVLSFAGHDAGIVAERLPTGMVFVRNATGVSHAPDEAIDLADAAVAAQALVGALEALA